MSNYKEITDEQYEELIKRITMQLMTRVPKNIRQVVPKELLQEMREADSLDVTMTLKLHGHELLGMLDGLGAS